MLIRLSSNVPLIRTAQTIGGLNVLDKNGGTVTGAADSTESAGSPREGPAFTISAVGILRLLGEHILGAGSVEQRPLWNPNAAAFAYLAHLGSGKYKDIARVSLLE